MVDQLKPTGDRQITIRETVRGKLLAAGILATLAVPEDDEPLTEAEILELGQPLTEGPTTDEMLRQDR